MEKLADKKIAGTTSLEEALEQFASKSEENREVLNVSLKMSELMNQMVDERLFLGMTQRGLAEVTGIKQPMIARIERLESIPRLDTFLKIADKLDFEVLLAYKVDFSPLNIRMKSLKYISNDNNDLSDTYDNNQMVYGRIKNEQLPNAA